jgi:hypothetical protein
VKGETVTTTRESRDRLFTRLREVLGTEQANTLIDMLPPEIDRLATKADMEQIAARMEGLETRMEGLETRMEKLEDRVWDLHEALRAQTRIYLTATVGSMFGVGSLAFAAAGLL